MIGALPPTRLGPPPHSATLPDAPPYSLHHSPEVAAEAIHPVVNPNLCSTSKVNSQGISAHFVSLPVSLEFVRIHLSKWWALSSTNRSPYVQVLPPEPASQSKPPPAAPFQSCCTVTRPDCSCGSNMRSLALHSCLPVGAPLQLCACSNLTPP
jgi:hypothetical protein